jgi:hypothetical protein
MLRRRQMEVHFWRPEDQIVNSELLGLLEKGKHHLLYCE